MIREMTLDDLEIVCEMELRLFSSPWPRESYEYELKENPYSHLFVAENEAGTIVGYAGVWTTFDQAQITTIGVDLPYRRQHWASRLMDHMINCAAENGCEMINIRKGYYQDNHEDAYLMMKPIGGNL